MKNLKEDYYNPFFSHIYIEKAVWDHPRTRRIRNEFPDATVIEIDHYKDVFCRGGQNYTLQHYAKNLILAAKEGNLIYEGAPVCQSFGNAYFYYTSCMMNCIYDCEYCYLKGMYPSGNMVVFVNLEDFFAEIQKILASHSMYLCVSYDTDLMALEHRMGYVREWIHFVEKQENLNIEIRTKSADRSFWSCTEQIPEVIYAFTLSPQAIIDAYEHGTPSLSQRILCVAEAVDRGFAVRLCFDPMIYCQGWEQQYDTMLDQIYSQIDMQKIVDVSVGTFRVSQDYLKKMRKIEPYSAVVQFPYQNSGGVYQYTKERISRMEGYLADRLKEKIPEEKIFLWKNIDEEK